MNEIVQGLSQGEVAEVNDLGAAWESKGKVTHLDYRLLMAPVRLQRWVERSFVHLAPRNHCDCFLEGESCVTLLDEILQGISLNGIIQKKT
jgi:hypothetical protein